MLEILRKLTACWQDIRREGHPSGDLPYSHSCRFPQHISTEIVNLAHVVGNGLTSPLGPPHLRPGRTSVGSSTRSASGEKVVRHPHMCTEVVRAGSRRPSTGRKGGVIKSRAAVPQRRVAGASWCWCVTVGETTSTDITLWSSVAWRAGAPPVDHLQWSPGAARRMGRKVAQGHERAVQAERPEPLAH